MIWTMIFMRSGDGHSKCVWKGQMPFALREDDGVVILDGFATERVHSAAYDLANATLTAELYGIDIGDDYPEVEW